MTREPNQRPDDAHEERPPGPAEPVPAERPEPDAVYDSAESALVAERLEALGYIE